jgi:hypothetical protein
MYTEKESNDYSILVLTSVFENGDESLGTGVDIDNGDVVTFRLWGSVAQHLNRRLQTEDEEIRLEIEWWRETSRLDATKVGAQ